MPSTLHPPPTPTPTPTPPPCTTGRISEDLLSFLESSRRVVCSRSATGFEAEDRRHRPLVFIDDATDVSPQRESSRRTQGNGLSKPASVTFDSITIILMHITVFSLTLDG